MGEKIGIETEYEHANNGALKTIEITSPEINDNSQRYRENGHCRFGGKKDSLGVVVNEQKPVRQFPCVTAISLNAISLGSIDPLVIEIHHQQWNCSDDFCKGRVFRVDAEITALPMPVAGQDMIRLVDRRTCAYRMVGKLKRKGSE